MSLIKNGIWNLGGFFIPTAIAIPCLGILARSLGTEKFGLFTLAFAIVGYASIFDAGLTRAVIREIAINRSNKTEQKKIMATSTLVVVLLACFATLLLYFLGPVSSSALKVSEVNIDDFNNSFKVLAFIIPVFLLNQLWLAYLEGCEKFANINIQRIISNSLIAGLPALFSMYSPTLTTAIAALLLGRVLSLLISFCFSRKMIIESGIEFDIDVFKRLIRFGGWMTVSNIISPIMIYFDRFVISHILGAHQVAYYTAPSEGVSRALNVPNALVRALFPRLSNVTNDLEKNKLEKISYFILAIIIVPIICIGFIYAQEIMVVWMGNDYSGDPVIILRILLVGFFFNAFAQIPFAKIQAIGKSHITAMLHLAEVLPYLILLYVLVNNYLLLGVAAAWSIRVTVDFFTLYSFARKIK